MTSRDFCYWLQGFLELRKEDDSVNKASLTPAQLECVQKHLALVFKHEIAPSMGPTKHQDALNKIHSGIGYEDKGMVLRC